MLTFEMLKTDLQIAEADHRLKIMTAIRYLFPSMKTTDVSDSDMLEVEECMSPMLHSSGMVSPPWTKMMNISQCNEELDE